MKVKKAVIGDNNGNKEEESEDSDPFRSESPRFHLELACRSPLLRHFLRTR